MADSTLSDQINALVSENRRLRMKSEADDKTIHVLKDQYAMVTSGMEDIVEDHRRIERELTIKAHKAQAAYSEMEGLLDRAADLILQAARARVGDDTPEKMPEHSGTHVNDARLPMIGPN